MRRPLLTLGHAAALAFIGIATLRPMAPEPFVGWTTCIICPQAGLAEAVGNVVLFVPLGFTLALAGWRRREVVLAGFALSLWIECAQMFIPGRDPNIGDIAWNTTGTALGIAVAALAVAAATASPARARRLGWGLAAAVVAALLAIGWLFQPASTAPPFRVQRRSGAADLILSATLGTVALDPGRVDPGPTREALAAGAALTARTVLGPRESAAYWLRLRDGRRRDVASIQKLGDDIVFRYRTRAADRSLEQPDVRARGILRDRAAGDTAEVVVARTGLRFCVALDGAAHCGLGPTLGRAWAFVAWPAGLAPPLAAALDALLLALLFAPLGLTLRRGGPGVAPVAAALAALLVLPWLLGLEMTPLTQLAGAALGVAAAWGGSRAGSRERGAGKTGSGEPGTGSRLLR